MFDFVAVHSPHTVGKSRDSTYSESSISVTIAYGLRRNDFCKFLFTVHLSVDGPNFSHAHFTV